MASLSLDSLLAYSTLAIIVLIGLPLFIICVYQFHKHYNETYFTRRHRILVVVSVVCFSSFLLIEQPFYQVLILLHGDLQSVPHEYILYCSFFRFFYFGNALIYSLRVWLLYFDHKYHDDLNKYQWKLLINPSHVESWYIRNRSTLGNPIVLYRGTAILWLIVCLLHLDVMLLTIHTSYFYIAIWCFLIGVIFICVLFMSMIWRKFPKYDEFCIKQELSLFLTSYILVSVCAMIVILLIVLVEFIVDHIISVDLSFVMYILSILMHLIGIYTNTWGAIRLMQRKNMQFQRRRESQGIFVKHLLEQFENLSLEKVLKHADGFNAFMNFLTIEFANETLLFLVEYIQLKKVIIARFGDQLEVIDDMERFLPFVLPTSLPQSMIVEQLKRDLEHLDEEDQYKAIIDGMKLLYYKYIAINKAKLELNVSYKIRNKLQVIFQQQSIYSHIIGIPRNNIKALSRKLIVLDDSINPKTRKIITILLPMLDECAQQAMILMIDAFFRFQQTDIAIELYQNKLVDVA